MRNKKVFITTAIAVAVVLTASVITITAQPERDPNKRVERPLPDTWYQREDIEKNKEITIFDPAEEQKEPASSVQTENKEELSEKKQLTYLGTDGSDEEFPLDIYLDEDKNQFRYNKDGEIDTYRKGYDETSNIETGDLTKEQALEKTKRFTAQLFGDRIKGFELIRCEARPSGGGYFVDFARKYGVNGFIHGAKCANEIQQNGEFAFCTLTNDLFEDFDPAWVENLTREQVLKKVATDYVAEHPEVDPAVIEMNGVDLLRKDDGFVLRALISYPDPQPTWPNYVHKDIGYYELEI